MPELRKDTWCFTWQNNFIGWDKISGVAFFGRFGSYAVYCIEDSGAPHINRLPKQYRGLLIQRGF
jgi:hypothetical protein